MIKYVILFVLFCFSCNMIETKLLGDKLTKVPSSTKFFKKNYRDKYVVKKPDLLATNSIYVEEYYLGFNNERFSLQNRRDILRFYDTGSINNFSFPIAINLNDVNLDPNLSGHRGIFYEKKNKTYFDIIAPISELRSLGNYKYELIKIEQDTIKIKRVGEFIIYVYSRKFLDNKNLLYNADW